MDLLKDELDELSVVLPHVYLKLAEAFVEGGGTLTDDVAEGYLPDRLFELSQLCRWISPASYRMSNTLSPQAVFATQEGGWRDPDDASIGRWCVNREFHDAFFKHLEPAIDVLKRIASADAAIGMEDRPVRWKEPTPPQIIDRFLKKKRWTKATLIRRMTGIDEYVDETTKQMLKRLYRPPTRETRTGKNQRTVSQLLILRDILAQEAPELFGSLKAADLCWTPM
jgi:hypothetical protein